MVLGAKFSDPLDFLFAPSIADWVVWVAEDHHPDRRSRQFFFQIRPVYRVLAILIYQVTGNYPAAIAFNLEHVVDRFLDQNLVARDGELPDHGRNRWHDA
jgi:hypothetical protein